LSIRIRSVLLVALMLVLALPGIAIAHEERESQFPDYATGSTPEYREFSESTPRLVVCKNDSDARIARIGDAQLRGFNEARLAECEFEHVQAAVDAVTVQGTNIYVLPGEYREEPSVDAPCAADYTGGIVEYSLIVSCGEVINLITIAGDTESILDTDIACDNQLCDLQIEGTGVTPQDTLVTGGFDEDGDWRKHNGIKADRADGFVLVNMAFELFRENAIYVHETSGYLLDRVEANFNDLYGILTFTSDRGVISNCETHHNGDSGVYPGSSADVNQESYPATGPIERYAVEIFGCDTHHNALGFSGTAGNSVWFHDNLVHHNGAGYVTDSFVGGHPGMPQDHAFLENNRIYSNNVNFYPNVQGDDAPCREARPVDRGHQDGVVCPVFPVPVGTGVMIAGGNANFLRNNVVYDNWRSGFMSFYVPAIVRYQGDIELGIRNNDPGALDALAEALAAELDTSHDNHFVNNDFGTHPDGFLQPNGLDVWWDDQGTGNCWQSNTSSTTDPSATISGVSNNANAFLLPTCEMGGSVNPVPNAAESGGLLPCAVFNRNDNPDPVGCDWLGSPQEPAGREAAPDDLVAMSDGGTTSAAGTVDPDVSVLSAQLAATGGGGLVALLGIGALVASGRLRRRDQRANAAPDSFEDGEQNA
jgi:hypothetical protein